MIIFLFTSVIALDIHFKLPPRQLRCFGDRLQLSEMIQGVAIAEFPDFSLKILEVESNKQIHYSYNHNEQPFSYTASQATQIQICIHNVGHTILQIQFKYESGIDQAPQMEDLIEFQKYLRHYNQSINHLKVEQKDLKSRQDSRNEQMNTISSKIVLFSILTILLMVMGTMFQSYKAAKIMKLKKSI